jgi:hypothetical protein
MKTINIIFVAITGLLVGCLSPQQIRQQQADTCSSYGFKPGTNQFAQCMMMQAKQAEREAECSRAALRGFAQAKATDPVGVQMAAGGDAQADCLAGRKPTPQPPSRQPLNTSCTRAGNTINCTTN